MPVCTKLCVKGTGGHGITHTLDGLLGFVCIFALFYLVVNRWHIFYGPALCASGCIIALFIGREFSDRQKLGYWDWEGLLVPSITVSVLAIVISIVVASSTQQLCCFAHKRHKVYSSSNHQSMHSKHEPSETNPKDVDMLIHNYHEHEHPDMDRRSLVLMPGTPYCDFGTARQNVLSLRTF